MPRRRKSKRPILATDLPPDDPVAKVAAILERHGAHSISVTYDSADFHYTPSISTLESALRADPDLARFKFQIETTIESKRKHRIKFIPKEPR